MTLFVALMAYALLVACIFRFFRSIAVLDRRMRTLSAELFPPSSPDQAA